MDPVTPATTDTPAEIPFSEFKKQESARLSGTPLPAAEKPAETTNPTGSATPEPGAKPSESAAVSETADNAPQDKGTKEKSDRSASARFAELTNERKAAEARAEKAERELEELRKGTRNPPESKPADKAEAKPDDTAPKEEDFATYADYIEARAEHRALKAYKAERAKESEEATQKAEQERNEKQKQTMKERITAQKAEYPDFDAKLKALDHIKTNPGISHALGQSENVGHVLAALAADPAEYERINAMEPYAALYAMGMFEQRTMAGRSPSPEKIKPTPISKAPPPPPQAGGTAPPTPTAAEAKGFSEYKRLEKQRLKLA